MLVKAVLIFLGAMVLVAMVGRALFPSLRLGRRPAAAATCRSCGRHLIGTGPCACQGKA